MQFVGFIMGIAICVPIFAVIPAAFLMLACKICNCDRPFIDAYKAAVAYSFAATLLNACLNFIGLPPAIGLPLQLLAGIGVAITVYSAILELEASKAFLVWLAQQGMLIALCLVVFLPIALATGVAAKIAENVLGTKQVAQADSADAAADAGGSAAPQPTADSIPQPAPTQEPAPDPSIPQPEATDSSTPVPEPTPESTTPTPTPTPESTTPVPESTPTPVVPATPAAPAEPTFPPGLQGDAQRAFHEGRIDEGKTYLRAALLSSDDKALWNNVRWYSGLGRPMMGLRWGVGLQMAEQPPSMPQRPDGGGQPAAAAPQENQPPAGGLGDNPLPAASGDLAELRKFTGEFGPKLLETLPKSTLDRLLGPLGEGVQMPQGVQFVGIGTDLSGVQSLARQKGVDVLLVAAISFKVYGLNRNVDAQLTVRLIDVATDKRLWSSKTLGSNQVKAAIAKGQDPIKDTVGSLTDYLEHSLQPLDKPDLDNIKLRQRADAVVREEQSNPLPALVELRYYQQKGLITLTQAEQYYGRLTDSENGPLLASGTPEERGRVVERFLPRSR